jgi:membrane fusion protein
MAYGAPRQLRAGMAVEADVLLETRRLYEWVLEPLYSLRGRAR